MGDICNSVNNKSFFLKKEYESQWTRMHSSVVLKAHEEAEVHTYVGTMVHKYGGQWNLTHAHVLFDTSLFSLGSLENLYSKICMEWTSDFTSPASILLVFS